MVDVVAVPVGHVVFCLPALTSFLRSTHTDGRTDGRSASRVIIHAGDCDRRVELATHTYMVVVVPGHRWCPGPWTNERRDSALTSLPWFCLVPGPGWQGRGDLTLTYAVPCSRPYPHAYLFLFFSDHLCVCVVLFSVDPAVDPLYFVILFYFIFNREGK